MTTEPLTAELSRRDPHARAAARLGMAQTGPGRHAGRLHGGAGLCPGGVGAVRGRRESLPHALCPGRHPPGTGRRRRPLPPDPGTPRRPRLHLRPGPRRLRLGPAAGQGCRREHVKVLGRLGVDRGEITLLEEQVLHTLAEAAVPLDPRQLKDELGDSVRSLARRARRRAPPPRCPPPSGSCNRRAGSAAFRPTAASTSSATPTSCGACRPARRRRRSPHRAGPPVPGLDRRRHLQTVPMVHGLHRGADQGGARRSRRRADSHRGDHRRGGALWMLPDDVERLAVFEEPAEEQIQLLAGTDSLVLLRRNAAELLAEDGPDGEDNDRKASARWRCRPTSRTTPSWTAAGSSGSGSTIRARSGSSPGSSATGRPRWTGGSPRSRPGSGRTSATSAPSAWIHRPPGSSGSTAWPRPPAPPGQPGGAKWINRYGGRRRSPAAARRTPAPGPRHTLPPSG